MTTLLLTLAVWTGASSVQPALPTSLDVTPIREMTVQHDGRWPPFDTLARDMADTITGQDFPDGRDPVLLLLSMTFEPRKWMQEPLIRISNAELRGELQLSPTQTVYSYQELVTHERLHELTDAATHRDPQAKPNPLEMKVGKINGKLGTLQRIFSGSVIRPVPDPKDPVGRWTPIPLTSPEDNPQLAAADAAWTSLRDAFLADDADSFTSSATALRAALAAMPAAYRPTRDRIATELLYNRMNPYQKAWWLLMAGAILACIAVFIKRAWADVLAGVPIVGGFGMLSYGIWLRWDIAGHVPASNMFESLLFLSWGMAAFAILSLALVRQRSVLLTSAFVAAVALMLADVLPMDHFIRPTTPVLLDTVWMAIHVPIIMVSYSVLALGVLIAHAQLVTMSLFPKRVAWIEAIDRMHYWYISVGSILLLTGIATGSMWAASSWGRYWGWDPKEVWSLVALLGYLTILHVRIDTERVPKWAYGLAVLMAAGLLALIIPTLAPLTGGKLLALGAAGFAIVLFVLAKGPFATAFKSILAFWLIIMTYVGVNYVLGIGLHSYGFGTGAIVKHMFRSGGADLTFIAICAVIYLIRRQGTSPGRTALTTPA